MLFVRGDESAGERNVHLVRETAFEGARRRHGPRGRAACSRCPWSPQSARRAKAAVGASGSEAVAQNANCKVRRMS